MQREVHISLIHSLYKKTYGCYHDISIRSLDRDYNVSEVLLNAHTKEFHTTLHHTFRSVTISAHDSIGKTTMIHTNSDGSMMFLTDVQERNESSLKFLYFISVFLVGIIDMLELTCRINVVTRVDSDFICIQCGHICHLSIKMHISNQWDIISIA